MKRVASKNDGVHVAYLICALVSAPILLTLGWLLAESRADVLPLATDAPVFAPIQKSEASKSTDVTVALKWGGAVQAAYSGIPGTVTGVAVSVGDEVGTGAALFEVDGLTVRAIGGPRPPTAQITPQSPTELVVAVNEMLAGNDLPVPNDSNVWTRVTTSSLAELARASRWPDRSGHSVSPEWLVWVPGGSVVIDGDLPQAGFPAPAPGTAVLSGRPVLVSADVITMPSDWSNPVLELRGGEQVPLTDGAPDLGMLGRLVAPDETQIEAKVVNSDPTLAVAVPPSAVISSGDGKQCVIVAADSSSAGRVVPVTIIGGEPGVTYLETSDVLTGRFMTNPIDAGRTEC